MNLSEDYYRNEIANMLADTDRVLENIFLFQNPWDMEWTNIPYHFEEKIDWNFQPEDDSEWLFDVLSG